MEQLKRMKIAKKVGYLVLCMNKLKAHAKVLEEGEVNYPILD